MAEFKLGRIRFVWQGDWAAGRAYVADDVVSNGGKSYICIRNHTSLPEFNTDFTSELQKWDIVSDGTSWRGDWEPEVEYNPGDVVKYGALVYICEVGHTSETFEAPTFLGLEADLDKWTPFATSFDFKGDWSNTTRYKINDLVRYGGYTYLCSIAHVSASTDSLGLEDDQEKWSLFSDGLIYLGEWTDDVRYRVNDIVKSGGNIWICINPHTSTDFLAQEANWQIFVQGFEFENSWNNSTQYQVGDTVTYGGYVYVAKENNLNKQPTTNLNDWDVFTTGFKFQGDWTDTTSYRVGDVVRIGGTTYVASADSLDQEPPNLTYWSRLNSGVNWTDNVDTFLQVQGTNVSGSGSGARFDVIKSKTVYTVDVSTGFAGTNYTNGNIIRIAGSLVGGLSPSNDILVTVTGVSSGAVTSVTWTGYSSTWKSGINYAVGDVVIFGANSYICITTHTSTSGDRPDLDLTATYWNLLTLGGEALALTTPGDLVYYGANGPTRLPIGVDGQILRASSGAPAWANYGLINNVVYVGPLGTNEPAPQAGLTIDKPWASVRYALDQVRDGYLNPNCKQILRNNKEFLMKEVTNWITYTYTFTVTAATSGTQVFTCNSTANLSVGMPIEFSGTVGGVVAGTKYFVQAITSGTQFRISNTLGGVPRALTTATGTMTGTLSYDSDFCERDTGYLVDALIYDISRGGTIETTNAANAYYTPAGNAYINSNFGTQIIQTVAAYTHLKEIVVQILSNEIPTSFQFLNDVAIEDRAVQVVDLSLVAESDGVAKAEQLVNIVTNGLLAGSNTAILRAAIPNTTVFIKTGTYNEILPIIVPEYTAIVGDELRTSVIQPAPNVPLLATDKNKTTEALNRIKSVIPELMQNIVISKTSGNTQEQEYINGYGGTTLATNRLNTGVELISDVLEQGLDYVDVIGIDYGPIPTSGTNNASDAGFANARAQIIANKEFIKAEITAWIAAQVAGSIAPFSGSFTYDATACARDVGYILDAVTYDVTYGGNLETTVAARAYFVDGSPVYGAGEKEETLASYARLKTVIGQVILETAVTTSAGNTLTQNTDGTAGSSDAATFAQARIQEIFDTIDLDGVLATEILPDTSWVANPLVNTNTDIDAVKSDIQSGAITWVQDTYPGFTFDTVKCSRDVGYIVDALRYDIMFGSTFRSLKAGMSYRRGIASTEVVINGQLEQTIGVVDYVRDEVKKVTGGTTKIQSSTAIVADILENGESAIPVFVTPDPVGYDTGFFNARRLIKLNRAFLIAEVEAFMAANYSSIWTPLSAGDKTAFLEDIDFVLDAIEYDITYRGNLETIVVARSYYSNGVFVKPSDQKTAILAVKTRLRDIIDNIAIGNTAGWTKSVGNALTQNTTGTAGSAGAAAFAQDRLLEIFNTINTAIDPSVINPSLAWVDPALVQLKTVVDSRRSMIQQGAVDYINFLYPDLVYNEALCARDVGYIVDAVIYDTIFGSNFRSSTAGASYLRGITSTEVVLNDQLAPTLSTISYINEALTVVSQSPTSKVGSTEFALTAASLADTIKQIVQSGLGAIPAIKLPQPTGYNSSALTNVAYAATGNTTGSTATYANAVAQIVANYDFIKAEVRAWLADPANGFDTIWNSFSATAQDACIRDVGYILDGVRYDLTYGGNTQSLIVGSAYYSNFVLTISQAELPATLAAYGRLRTVLGQVILETTVTKSPTNALNQNTAGTAGNAASAAFAQDRVDDVTDWISNGNSNATITPAISWTGAEIRAAFNRILDRKTEIVEDVVYWVEKFWQKLRYNQGTCRRDVGYMVDAIAYDMITGSNFASIIAGRAYYRATASAQVVVANQLEATVGAVNFLKYKIKHVAALSASASAELIIDDITAYINGGKRPALRWVSPSNADAQFIAAADTIWENKSFIQAEVIAYLDFEYPNIVYSEEKCARDVGYIIDALRYDLTYGGSSASKAVGETYYFGAQLQIDEADKLATKAAYEYIKTLVGDLALGGPIGSPGIIQTEVTPIYRDALQTVGSIAASQRAETLVQLIVDILDLGNAGKQTVTISSIASNVITTTGLHGLKIGDELQITSSFGFNGLVSNTTYYVASTPTTSQITLSTFFGGAALTTLVNGTGINETAFVTINPVITQVDAVLRQQHINLMGSKATIQTLITEWLAENYPTLDYDQNKCERDVGLILDAISYDMMLNSNYKTVIAALAYYRGAQADLVLKAQKIATVQAYRELKNLAATYVTSSATAVNRINNAMDIIINILDKGDGDTPEINGTITYFNDIETINGVDILKANRTFLANEATAWVTQTFGGTISAINTAGVNTFSTIALHKLIKGDPIVFSANVGGLTAGTTYYVVNVPTETEFGVATTLNGTQITLTSSLVGTVTVSYKFDPVACRRDMERYIDAVVYDLQYPGNHKGIKAAELYLNAVIGSERSDMFHVRNGTGVRNMTLNGLRGQLTELNENGTRRPTAGAYVSLDPGFGPWDTDSWVTNKSCYVQNVSTFGVGCVGNKIDGAIHAGGNRSVVSNDFTQILSDGIGVWCSGNDSLTELVSVFAYYNYAGYLADGGARIRATNGNSSYGTYGVIAEGTDSGEIPLFAELDNLSQEAIIGEVITDGAQQVLRFEYANAGRSYTNAEFAISGAGFNATAEDDEFRDGAVFETRIIDLDDGNDVGGADYVTARNVAQGGDLISVTIAATDTALSNAYNGMRIQLTVGTGVGQFANILSFNNGTKGARVYKDSFDNLTITATTSSTNRITVASTSTLYVDMPIWVGSAVGNLAVNTAYYVTAIISTTQFTVSTEAGGTDVVLTTTTGQSVTLYAAGWDHVIPGFPIAESLDLTTGYTIEPRLSYTAPGFTSNATTSSTSTAFRSAAYAGGRYVAVNSSGTVTNYSTNGTTWLTGGTVPTASYVDVVFGGGSGATARAIVGGLGGSGAVLQANLGTINSIGLPGPTQIQSITVLDGGVGYSTAPTIEITPVLGGGGASAICTVLNGSIQEVIITSTGAGYGAAPTITAVTDKITDIIVDTFGNGYTAPPTVTITGGGASSAATATAVVNNQGVASITIDTNGVGYTSTPTVVITDSNARFVAIANGSTVNARLPLSSAPNANWSAGTALPNSNFTSLAYGGGVYVAVGGTGGSGGAATSSDGSAWVSRTNVSLSSGTFTGVAHGAGVFVAINGGGNQTATSTNGIAWVSGGNLPASTTWSSIAYGNGRFVAIASGGRSVAYSYNKGLAWIASPAGLPSSQTWTKIKYGQGLFVAVAEGTNVCATSPNGVDWTERTMSASGAWNALAFGNPNSRPTWVALTNAANTAASAIKTGAKASGRADINEDRIARIRMVEPGSGYPTGTPISTTAPSTITLDSTNNIIANQPITFVGATAAGLEDGVDYYVVAGSISGNNIQVSLIPGSGTALTVETATIGGTFRAGPILDKIDPNSTVAAASHSRLGDGALANPTFPNRGTGYTTATAELSGDGFADLFQPSTFVAVRGLFDIPEPGSNVEFTTIPNSWYKLVTISNIIGEPGNYTATFQISPSLTVLNAPRDGTLITTTNKYSQVRLTGHDFLYIGTGNQATTNYPFVDITTAYIEDQTLASGGGRVFFTSTDQDGNFNVGGLFGVQQSTGTATLDADAFNLAGLQSLQLGGISVGIGGAIITQFSTDPFFTANSDNIVPTQRAIKSYITAQIGGGQSSLNVNTLTAGVVFVANDTITTTSGGQLNIKAKMNFTGGIDGAPVALGFFLQR
jgi:predicted transcriptional regulator